MRKNQKKELLTKLREINRLDRRKRNSDKNIFNLNYNLSNNTSFSRDPATIASEDGHRKLMHALSARKFQASQPESTRQIQEQARQLPIELSSHAAEAQFIKVENNNEANGSMDKVKVHRFFQERQSTSRKQREDPALQTLSSLLQAPHRSTDNFRIRCKQCQKIVHAKDEKIESLTKDLKQAQIKLKQTEERIIGLKKTVAPYINNVNLLSVVVDSLQEKEWNGMIDKAKPEEEEVPVDGGSEPGEMQQTVRVNKYLLKEGRQKDKLFSNQIYRLKSQIDALASENSSLKTSNLAKQAKLRILQQQLHYYQNSNSMRERMQMCREELYTYKLRYQEKNIQSRQLTIKSQQMKYKLNVLTSLIGCAIIFDLKEKENDKKYLREFINKIDKYETVTHNLLENNGFHYLRFLEALHKEETETKTDLRSTLRTTLKPTSQAPAQSVVKPFVCRRLYFPNYLSLLGEQSIGTRAEHIIIKPILFLKLRSILDCKYIDYRLFECSAPQFSDFCNSHLKNYEIQQSEKKIYYITRQITENEFKQMNIDFMKCLLDERIQDLPEVEVFREFMLGKYEEDEIYFYLMCRHKFMQGSELQNFINSGDPSKFVKFDKAKRLVLKITEKFGRNIQNFICYHINERKIYKNGQQFVRIYYMLKLLLMVYRKIRAKKIEEFKQFFDSIMQTTSKDTLNFQQFNELIRKNFQFLMRNEICHMYRTTIAVFESQRTQTHFFQCFFATCGARMFLMELIRYDKQLEFDCMNQTEIMNFHNNPIVVQKKSNNQYRVSNLQSTQIHRGGSSYSHFRESPKINQLNDLWPDSVYILGSEKLNKDYVQLLRSNHQRSRTKLQTLTLLVSLVQGHLVKQNIHLKGIEDLSLILSDAIYNMIQFLNKIQKHNLEHENQINLASRKIGKFFKNKIYEFYHQMLEDINNITHKPTDKDFKKNKRYLKEKARASKIFQPSKYK